ncbi:MAG TPA: isoprenylcysteine carboxylmethyltransferase family protein, partial [Caulobacteraceae bacterium]
LPDGDIGAVRFAAGIALMWLGIGLRQWSVATLGRFFRITVVVQEDHKLVTAGPYRWLRNPSYSGVMLTVLGQGLTFGNWVALLVLVGGVLAALAWRIAVEARALRGHFGPAYEAWAKKSWALIPWVW